MGEVVECWNKKTNVLKPYLKSVSRRDGQSHISSVSFKLLERKIRTDWLGHWWPRVALVERWE
jgi:hypothetical protein